MQPHEIRPEQIAEEGWQQMNDAARNGFNQGCGFSPSASADFSNAMGQMFTAIVLLLIACGFVKRFAPWAWDIAVIVWGWIWAFTRTVVKYLFKYIIAYPLCALGRLLVRGWNVFWAWRRRRGGGPQQRGHFRPLGRQPQPGNFVPRNRPPGTP